MARMSEQEINDVQRTSPQVFEAQITQLVDEAEDIRMRLMGEYDSRERLSTAATIIFVMIGSAGFGWFLLMEGKVSEAVLCVIAGIILPLFVSAWAQTPIQTYKDTYKSQFMPKLAKLLGGFKFHAARGISGKIITRAGILPKFETYKAEDCFMGTYKGVKVIFSEARLYRDKRASQSVFDGVFVLLEIPSEILEGHTILSADREMVKRYAQRRWKSLQRVELNKTDVNAQAFQMYSDAPEAASLLAGEKLLKELSEAGAVFNNAPISAVFFRKKYVFLTIPYSHDMFEASNVQLPVKTQQHALQCKKEIEQILEVIDVFDLYQKPNAG